MKKLIVSLLALLVCASVLFVGCKKKDNNDDETTAIADHTISITQAPTTELPLDESTTVEESTTQEDSTKPSTTAPAPTTQQTVQVTEPKVDAVKKINSYAWNTDGTYKCGNDEYSLVPGEYHIVRTGSGKCTVTLTNGKGTGITRDISNDTLITLNKGYTITIKGGKFTHSSKSHPGAGHNGTYESGIYKVGRDIPAGEYVARKTSSAQYAGLTFRKSTDYFANEALDLRTVDNPIYITLEAGEYVEVAQGYLTPYDGKPIAKENSDGSYSSGMYKVGVDIPAGRYMVTPTTSNSIYCIYRDSLYTTSSVVKTQSKFTNTVEVKVTNGQYIQISGCKITSAVGGLEPSTQAPTEASTQASTEASTQATTAAAE